MRPDRAIVKKAIQDAEGNLSRAAVLLGCTRPTLYTWIYQHGLQRLAGVRIDREVRVDRGVCLDTRVGQSRKSGVKSAEPGRPMLSLVETQSADLPVQATVRVSESLWKEVKIEAIRRDTTVGALVEEALKHILRRDRKAGAGGGAP